MTFTGMKCPSQHEEFKTKGNKLGVCKGDNWKITRSKGVVTKRICQKIVEDGDPPTLCLFQVDS